MRAYFFGNMYLSQIQQGIQAAHVTAEFFMKYPEDHECNKIDLLDDWARNHKTMILLNGGYGENLHDLLEFFVDGNYPFAYFCESKEALDGAITSVGIVLPPKIYVGAREASRVMRLRTEIPSRMLFEQERILNIELDGEQREVEYTEWEVELMQRLNTFRLA